MSEQSGQVAGTPAMPQSPAETGDPRLDRESGTDVAAASDTPSQPVTETKDPPPGQQQEPQQGRPATGEPAPEEIGESG